MGQEALQQPGAFALDGVALPGGDLHVQRHVGVAPARRGGDEVDRCGADRRELVRLRGCLAGGDVAEVLLHQRLELVHRQVADGDEGHVGRHVPEFVEVPQHVGGHGLDDLGRADRVVALVGGVLGVGPIEDAVDDARAGLVAQPQLVADHAALLDDVGLGDGGRVGPLGEHVEGGLHGAFLGGHHVEFVDGLVVGRVGVDVRAELHAEAPQRLHDVVAGIVLGAVEHHVLEEVGDAEVRRGLVHGPGVHRQAQRQVAARLLVVAEVVGEAVVERADVHLGIHRQQQRGRLHDRLLLHGLGGRLLDRLFDRLLDAFGCRLRPLRRCGRLCVGLRLGRLRRVTCRVGLALSGGRLIACLGRRAPRNFQRSLGCGHGLLVPFGREMRQVRGSLGGLSRHQGLSGLPGSSLGLSECRGGVTAGRVRLGRRLAGRGRAIVAGAGTPHQCKSQQQDQQESPHHSPRSRRSPLAARKGATLTA